MVPFRLHGSSADVHSDLAYVSSMDHDTCAVPPCSPDRVSVDDLVTTSIHGSTMDGHGTPLLP